MSKGLALTNDIRELGTTSNISNSSSEEEYSKGSGFRVIGMNPPSSDEALPGAGSRDGINPPSTVSLFH